MMIRKKKLKILTIKLFDVIKKILISEKEFPETNYKRSQKPLVYIEKQFNRF